MVGTVSRKHGKDIKFNTFVLKKLCRTQYFIKGILPFIVNAETVVFKITVKAQPDQKAVFFEKLCPFFGNKRSVCLQRKINLT